MSRRRLRALAPWILAAVLTAAIPAPGRSQQKGEIIDRILAVVEDRTVMQSEVELEIRNYMAQAQRTSLPADEEKSVRREILNNLINDLLMIVHAEKLGIEIADSEVENAVESRLEENRRALGGEEAFEKQLESEGLTLASLRELYWEKLRAGMLVERLMYREVYGEVEVTESDIKEYYRAHAGELPRRPETVTLAHILIVPRAAGDAVEAAKARIDSVYRDVLAGGDFAELAKEHSEGPSAPNGGSLGYLKLEDLNTPAFEAAVRKLTAGQTSEPVLTEFGWHIIRLEDVSGDRVLVRHILMKVDASEVDTGRSAELAERLRSEILAGADFEEMAARHSDDERTKDSGGVVGEIPFASLPEFFREMIRGVGEGEIAPVIRESKGFRIVKVLGRAPERVYAFEEAKDELRKLIQQQRLKERIKEYVDGLKNLYYVETKENM